MIPVVAKVEPVTELAILYEFQVVPRRSARVSIVGAIANRGGGLLTGWDVHLLGPGNIDDDASSCRRPAQGRLWVMDEGRGIEWPLKSLRKIRYPMVLRPDFFGKSNA